MTTKRIVHKYITKPAPSKNQPDAVKIFYLCNQAVEAKWQKTDITPFRITCKNCKKILKNLKEPTYCKGCSFRCQATECECTCHDKMREYWEIQKTWKK